MQNNKQTKEDLLDELIDSDGDITIYGLSFQRSRIIKELDATAYRCMLADMEEEEEEETDLESRLELAMN